jgi:putative DNA primase/helicase
MRVLYSNIPAELKVEDQWVCWRYEIGTKMLKVAGTLRNAKSTDPETWRSFGTCVSAEKRHPGRYAGVGFVFTKPDPYVGVDLDDVRDSDTGDLTPRAEEIVSRLCSYAEVSPSGTGVKRWVRAELSRAWKKPGVEIYPHSR